MLSWENRQHESVVWTKFGRICIHDDENCEGNKGFGY